MIAQRRPGREPRRHPDIRRQPARAPTTLNEGRGANPGDTSAFMATIARPGFAQRRPGREPRRHFGRQRQGLAAVVDRSTKAGARTPATLANRSRFRDAFEPLNEGRGANPGDTPPWRCSCPRRRTLNEGRGANPGDTTPGHHRGMARRLRSTKAGARTPATRGGPIAVATAIAPAQRRPGREPRRHRLRRDSRRRGPRRSTKAGARTPATHPGAVGVGLHRDRSTKAGARTPATPEL